MTRYTLYAIDGTVLGTFRPFDWNAIEALVREHYPDLGSWDSLDDYEIPGGPLEGQEIVVNAKTGEWLACFDLDVVDALAASRQAMLEAAE